MPMFRFATNLLHKDLPKDFKQQISTIISEITDEPETRILVEVATGADMGMNHTTQPCASGSLWAVAGDLSPEKNIQFSTVFFEMILKELNIPKDRMILQLKTSDPCDIGYNGTTVVELRKKRAQLAAAATTQPK